MCLTMFDPTDGSTQSLRWEKEGRGPIVAKAGEQLTTTVDANTLFHHVAARQRHWDPR
jgi:hypothetical protein